MYTVDSAYLFSFYFISVDGTRVQHQIERQIDVKSSYEKKKKKNEFWKTLLSFTPDRLLFLYDDVLNNNNNNNIMLMNAYTRPFETAPTMIMYFAIVPRRRIACVLHGSWAVLFHLGYFFFFFTKTVLKKIVCKTSYRTLSTMTAEAVKRWNSFQKVDSAQN